MVELIDAIVHALPNDKKAVVLEKIKAAEEAEIAAKQAEAVKAQANVELEKASADEPINSANAYYIKKRLTEKISNSNIVLGIAGMYASYSDWMEWELDKAIELGVPIVGVIPRGQERISQTVSSRSKQDVRWNTESIVAAIRLWAN